MSQRDEIKKWFKRGVSKRASHMLVCCDTFSYEYNPLYATDPNDVTGLVSEYQKPDKMSKVMEVYDLGDDMEEQLALGRCWRTPGWREEAPAAEHEPSVRAKDIVSKVVALLQQLGVGNALIRHTLREVADELGAETRRTNNEGLTWEEWFGAATLGRSAAQIAPSRYVELRQGWEKGEDPTEYAAQGYRERE